MVFVETPVFTRLVTTALSDRDYAALQQELADHPYAGRLIEGGAGIRKLRWAAQSAQISHACRSRSSLKRQEL